MLQPASRPALGADIRTDRRGVQRRSFARLLLAACAGLCSILAGCTGQQGASLTTTVAAPPDPGSVTVVAGQATTLDLGGGADLIIPPGAVTPGAVVSATYHGAPAAGMRGMTRTSAPVELESDPADAIHGLLTLEFPVPAGSVPTGVDPATYFGVSTYDAGSSQWVPYQSTYDSARKMVVAEIPHFSWWNPISWDWDQLYADVAQGFGQLWGTRSGPARCSGPEPSWVNQLVGVGNGADIAVHDCAQAQGDVLDIEIQNNRPYSMILTYGGPVKWGWTESGDSPLDTARNAYMKAHGVKSNQLYIPPNGAASVGILKPAAGSNTIWHIGPTGGTIGMDLLLYMAGSIAPSLVGPSIDCLAQTATTQEPSLTPGALRDYLIDIAGCDESALTAAVKSGKVGDKTLALIKTIRGANLVGDVITWGGLSWRVSDLAADSYVTSGTMLGAGFSVLAHNAPQPAAPTTSNQAAPAPKPSSPPPITQVPLSAAAPAPTLVPETTEPVVSTPQPQTPPPAPSTVTVVAPPPKTTRPPTPTAHQQPTTSSSSPITFEWSPDATKAASGNPTISVALGGTQADGSERFAVTLGNLSVGAIEWHIYDPAGGDDFSASSFSNAATSGTIIYDVYPGETGIYTATVLDKVTGRSASTRFQLTATVNPLPFGDVAELSDWAPDAAIIEVTTKGSACQGIGAAVAVFFRGVPTSATAHLVMPDGTDIRSGGGAPASEGAFWDSYVIHSDQCTGGSYSGFKYELLDTAGHVVLSKSFSIPN